MTNWIDRVVNKMGLNFRSSESWSEEHQSLHLMNGFETYKI